MKKKICAILIAVLVAVLGASTYFIIEHYKEANKQAELYDDLADLVEAAVQTDSATEPTEQIPYSEEKMLLPELAGLYQQNGDLVGWISIADTNINYPVMQSVNEPNFYLKHGFDKEYSDYGCPYVQEDCDVQKPSDNLVIYGHHMSNGSMFAHLEKFKSKDFWSEHRMITFNTLTDKQEYEIVAVFRTVVYTDSPEAFKFYRFIDAESANEFDEFIFKSKHIAINDGVDSAQGDNDMSALRNLFNEWMVRDTSKKIKAVFRAKGMSGKPITSQPVYGYLKGPDGHFVVDPEAAPVVKQIFSLCLAGNGPTKIARMLTEQNIPTPGTMEYNHTPSSIPDLSFCLVPKEPTKPATLLNRFCLTLRLIGSGLAGKKLLMHCPSMESLGRCRSLLCRHQRRADLRQPCVQFLDLLVLYSKLLAFPV